MYWQLFKCKNINFCRVDHLQFAEDHLKFVKKKGIQLVWIELLGTQPNTRVYNVFNQTDSYSPRGTTLQRPTRSLVRQEYFDTTLNRPVWWNGSIWIDGKQSAASPDTVVAPSNTYTPSEVQAILAELRDLKTKLRSAGILAI